MIHLRNRSTITTALLDHMRSGAAWLGYRRTLRAHLVRTLSPRLLAALVELPLPLSDTPGAAGREVAAVHWLRSVDLAALCERSRMPLALVGPPGSGRSLVLAQVAWRWAQGGTGIPPLLLDLPRGDDPTRSPHAIICAALADAGEPPPATDGLIETRRPWLLLVSGWEELPLERQADWHNLFMAMPRVWPDAQLVLTLPDEATRQRYWPTSMPIALRPPDDELLERMLAVLLPRGERAPLLAALAPGGPLAPLRERMLDLLLLAWMYPEAGLPTSRSALWSWAVAHSGADGTKLGGPWLRDHQLMRVYCRARDLAAQPEQIAALSSLPSNERSDLALFLAEVLPNPVPLLSTLWGEPAPTSDGLLFAGRSLLRWWQTQPADRIAHEGAGTLLRLIAALADGNDQQGHSLLRELQPLLQALVSVVQTGEEQQTLLALTRQLPRAQAESLLLALIDQDGYTPTLRWMAADHLLAEPFGPTVVGYLASHAAPDNLGGAARCYLLALGGHEAQAALDHHAAPTWVAALVADEQAGAERRLRVGEVLLAGGAAPSAVRAVAPTLLAATPMQAQPLLAAAVRDAAAPVRAAALQTLRAHDPLAALRQLAATLFDATLTAEQRGEALAAIGSTTLPEAALLLARCTLVAHLPFWLRLRAVELLAARRGAPTLLRKLLRAPAAHDTVRARAALLLADLLGNGPPPNELIEAAIDGAFPLARHEAVRALGRIGRSEAAVPVLTALVVAQGDDADLLETAFHALAHQAGAAAIPWLAGWLGKRACERLRADWAEDAMQLPAPLAESWPRARLSASRRLLLATTFAACVTPADEPTTLHELLEHQAARLSAAAADTLAAIGEPAARFALRDAAQTAPAALLPPLFAALAAVDPSGDALLELLATPGIDGRTRWLAVQHVPNNLLPGACDQLLHLLADDPFARGGLALALAHCPANEALPHLKRLADSPYEQPYVREQALAAIGTLGGLAAEAALLAVVCDLYATTQLRAAAAAALPMSISPDGCQRLRELLRGERPEMPLLVGILQALGNAHDRGSLPLLLRFCQHEEPDVALAAIGTLEQIGDPTVVSVLVNVSQAPNATPAVRLRAAGAVLRLGGDDYLPLLLPVLDGGLLPLQLQALELLLAAQPDSPLLVELLRDPARALPLRQRAARTLAGMIPPLAPHIRELFCTLLADGGESPVLRLLLADMLLADLCARPANEQADSALLALFKELASDPVLPATLRWRALNGLGALGPAAAPALNDLADDVQSDETIRSWAERWLYIQVRGER